MARRAVRVTGETVEARGEAAHAGYSPVEVRAVALGAGAGTREKRGPVIDIPVRGMFAGVRVYDRFVVRGAAAGNNGKGHNGRGSAGQ